MSPHMPGKGSSDNESFPTYRTNERMDVVMDAIVDFHVALTFEFLAAQFTFVFRLSMQSHVVRKILFIAYFIAANITVVNRWQKTERMAFDVSGIVDFTNELFSTNVARLRLVEELGFRWIHDVDTHVNYDIGWIFEHLKIDRTVTQKSWWEDVEEDVENLLVEISGFVCPN